MSAITMQPTQFPHRKPLPSPSRQPYAAPPPPSHQQPPPPSTRHPYQQPDPRAYSTSRTELNVAPGPPGPADPAASMYSMQSQVPPQQYGSQSQLPHQQQQPPTRTHRALSNATSSTSSTQHNGLQRVPTNASSGGANGPRRSGSSRSASSASPTSYVTLMRKQKATVWCDRAQPEDPHNLAVQRAAKHRAQMEVAGGGRSRMSTGGASLTPSVGIRSKIRHHGAPKASTYSGAGILSGAGVPMRLSASEVDENDSDNNEEQDSKYMNYHQRNSSGRSSLNSGGRPNHLAPGAGAGRGGGGSLGGYRSSNSTPSATGLSPAEGSDAENEADDALDEVTPGPNSHADTGDYFSNSLSGGSGGSSGGSAAVAAEESSFGRVGGLPQTTTIRSTADHERHTSEELRRRGSVDDRSMSMSAGVRLFVANPDLSD